MKYVIISLQSGRVKSDGPLLLIKANPIKDIENLSVKPLPSVIHEESQNTAHFAFKISIELIEAFAKALEDSKAEKRFWEPNMDEYVQDKITDFEGKEVFAYKHHSLRLNLPPKPEEILPNQSQILEIQPKKVRTIEKKEMGNVNEYIKSGLNSFDCMLSDYDNSKKIFAYPVLVSENFGSVINRCRFSQFKREGVYLKNDIIQPEINSPKYLRHSLLCSGYNRYYTSYYVQEEIKIYYRFFSKEANRLIFNLFNEIAYPIPFDSNRMVNIYETGNQLGISESAYAECKQNQITKEDVIGFVCCDVMGLDNSIESILYLLTYEPIDNTRTTRFDLYDSRYKFIESKYLNSNSSKLITWAFIYDLQKKAGIFGSGLVINDAEKCKYLLNYIAANYDSFSDKEKDMCAYIVPDRYKLTNQDKVQQEWLHNYVVNLGTLVRNQGLIISATMPLLEESIPKQVDKVIEVIDKRKMFFLNSNIDYAIDAALVLILINLGVQGTLKKITGLWAFYHLTNIKNRDSSPLVLEMILLIFKNNQKLFMDLINRIKSKSFVEYREVKSFFGTKTIEERTTWSTYNDEYCYFELLYEYSNNGKGFQLNDFETEFFSQRFVMELELDCIDSYFRNYPSINHTTINITNQRRFFRNELEKYISERIENKDFVFKDITM